MQPVHPTVNLAAIVLEVVMIRTKGPLHVMLVEEVNMKSMVMHIIHAGNVRLVITTTKQK